MGNWQIGTVSKDDPNTIVTAHAYESTALILSTHESRRDWDHGGYIYVPNTRDRPLEITIVNGEGRTALVFLQKDAKDRLIVHGHIEGGRHAFGWRGKGSRRVCLHLQGVEGILRLAPAPDSKFTFLREEGGEAKGGAGGVLELEEVELRITVFRAGQGRSSGGEAAHQAPPAYSEPKTG